MTNINDLIVKVGSGWEQLIIDAVEEAEKAGAEIRDVRILRGMLFFDVEYPKSSAETLAEVLRKISYESSQICEECGQLGKSYRKGKNDVTVLCVAHAAEEDYGSPA